MPPCTWWCASCSLLHRIQTWEPLRSAKAREWSWATATTVCAAAAGARVGAVALPLPSPRDSPQPRGTGSCRTGLKEQAMAQFPRKPLPPPSPRVRSGNPLPAEPLPPREPATRQNGKDCWLVRCKRYDGSLALFFFLGFWVLLLLRLGLCTCRRHNTGYSCR